MQSNASLPLIDEEVFENLRDLETEGEPSIIGELIDMFIEDSHALLAAMNAAAEAGKAEQLRESAHRLKGASKQLGATRMVALCQEIELQGMNRSLANTGQSLQALSGVCQETLKALGERRPADSTTHDHHECMP